MRLVIFVTMLLALAGCGDGAALDRLAAGGRGRVTEVPAADQVILADGSAVKLAGMAALRPRDPYGEEARKTLEGLVLGKEVEVLVGGAAEDPFGRRVGQLRRVKDRRWVQGALLEAGAGRVRTFPDQRAMAGEMLEREAKARAAKRGLWALADYQVRLPWEAQRGFQIVEGKVTAVRGASLDLEGFIRAEVPARAVRDFEAAGEPLASLAGRLVRVRGNVRGKTLWLDHPEALEVLSPSPSGRG